ncbi:uncharacterized protein F4817DRAFT_329018 [Daldinia loculata]|uniref:uncharacterized protein n=1 Tax=Daldinia loculata TaxID=103429 RepID=UPI0020C4AC27|nr:uncharacterized protein F4817DRAFT_329018 [Daldinia loculata]KAI1649876.1 hypothetical protein F4817DRAFT_329018 [Daldinia loculata]
MPFRLAPILTAAVISTPLRFRLLGNVIFYLTGIPRDSFLAFRVKYCHLIESELPRLIHFVNVHLLFFPIPIIFTLITTS